MNAMYVLHNDLKYIKIDFSTSDNKSLDFALVFTALLTS